MRSLYIFKFFITYAWIKEERAWSRTYWQQILDQDGIVQNWLSPLDMHFEEVILKLNHTITMGFVRSDFIVTLLDSVLSLKQ